MVFFQISSSIDNVKHIFVYLKNSYRNAELHRQAENSPFTMNTFSLPGGTSLSNCRLEYGNGIFYPETEYDSESKVRIFNDVMAYAMRKNDYNTGTQLNTSNYNSLYPLIYFESHLSVRKGKQEILNSLFLDTDYQQMPTKILQCMLWFFMRKF